MNTQPNVKPNVLKIDQLFSRRVIKIDKAVGEGDSQLSQQRYSKCIVEYFQKLGFGTYGECFKARKIFDPKESGAYRGLNEGVFAAKVQQVISGDQSNKRENKPNRVSTFQTQINIMNFIKKGLPLQQSKYFLRIDGCWWENLKICEQDSNQNTTENYHIAMEYCPNGSLRAYLDRLSKESQQLSEQQIFFILHQMSTALSILHANLIIHRDIKFDNVLFDRDFNLKIGDFGFSHKFQKQGEMASYCCGTEHFMAPEVAQKKLYDFKADVYSLGVMIYDLLMRNYNSDGPTMEGSQMQWNIKQRMNDSDCCRFIKQLLTEMLESQPKKRISSKDLRERIEDFKLGDLTGEQQQEKIKKRLRQKKTVNKVQVQKVIYTVDEGYCVILENTQTFLIFQQGQNLKSMRQEDIIVRNMMIKQDQFSEYFGGLDDWQQKKYVEHATLLPPAYFNFLKDWRNSQTIDEFSGDQTFIVNARILAQKTLLLKLSNGVIQCFFAPQEHKADSYQFFANISLNFNRKSPQKIRVSLTGDKKQGIFKDFSDALRDDLRSQYVLYLQKVLMQLKIQEYSDLSDF